MTEVFATSSRRLANGDLEAENERLQRQLTAVNSRQDDATEIVEYVENQREMEQQHQQCERKRRQASVLKRG